MLTQSMVDTVIFRFPENDPISVDKDMTLYLYRDQKTVYAKHGPSDDPVGTSIEVSRKNGRSCPYAFRVNGDGVKLIVRGSTNPVEIDGTEFTDGSFTITRDQTVTISRFSFELELRNENATERRERPQY